MKHKYIKSIFIILILAFAVFKLYTPIKAAKDIPQTQKTGAGLVNFCYDALNDECGYVWGAEGQICTSEFLDKQMDKYPNSDLAGIAMHKLGQKWIGKRVVDCSGLIKYYLTSNKYGEDPIYDEELYCSYIQDLSPMCGNIEYNDDNSNTMPEIPGLCVSYPGHIGVYVGQNKVIESMGTQFGVVETVFSARDNNQKWVNWCMCPRTEYKAKITTNKDKNGNVIYKKEKKISHKILEISKDGKSVKLELSNNKKSAWFDITDIVCD